jgi:D-serine deaminase-like pyridoxal phosphate-dependent protein
MELAEEQLDEGAQGLAVGRLEETESVEHEANRGVANGILLEDARRLEEEHQDGELIVDPSFGFFGCSNHPVSLANWKEFFLFKIIFYKI